MHTVYKVSLQTAQYAKNLRAHLKARYVHNRKRGSNASTLAILFKFMLQHFYIPKEVAIKVAWYIIQNPVSHTFFELMARGPEFAIYQHGIRQAFLAMRSTDAYRNLMSDAMRLHLLEVACVSIGVRLKCTIIERKSIVILLL